MVKAVWKPFESEFGSFTKTLENQNQEVKEEVNLAAEQAAFQERRLQASHRQRTNVFSQRFNTESAESRKWRLQIEERKSSTRLLLKVGFYSFHS